MAFTSSLDYRKWFDRYQPQTLQIATFLLYFKGFFALVDWLGRTDWIGAARVLKGSTGSAVTLAVVVAYIAGGFLMANERQWGYRLAVVAAFSPFLLRLWVLQGTRVSLLDRLTGGRVLTLIFDVALVALLLHPMSRNHQRVYYR